MLLLALVFLVFARFQFRFNLSSFLLASAHERILSLSRLAALDLNHTPREDWTKVMRSYSAKYPAKFYLFEDNETQLAGDPVAPPEEFWRIVRRHFFMRGPGHPPRPPDEFSFGRGFDPSGPPPDRGGGPPPPIGAPMGPPPNGGPGFDGPRHDFRADGPLDLLTTSHPTEYWVGVHVPLPNTGNEREIHALLVWRFPSLWTERFYFDPRPWILVIGIVLIITAVCWIPLVRGMTKTIRRITAATGNIADGHFDVTLAATRRDELGQLSDSINRMAGRLSGYVHGQKRFLGDIAHELSSPIARMQMALGVLEQRSSEREATYVADVREELEHMSTLVNELLQFSRSGIARQKCSLQPVDIPDVLRRAVNREGVPEVIFRTEVDPDVHAMADPECLFRAFANIIRNAVRYAGDAGPITLSAKENSDRVRISIADCGPGIPASELENIFRPFYRPEFARTRETGGVGLGLAIVRDSIESCGGRVECRNRIPQGLEVVIELTPAKAPSSAGAH